MKLNSVLAPAPLLALLLIVLPGPASLARADNDVRGPLACQIEYWSVGHLGERNDAGWLLAWKGTVSGALSGELRYWFPPSPPAPESAYSHGEIGYYLARWELWDGEELILAGESAGKTVIAEGQDGIWDGHGIVLLTSDDWTSLQGRKIYETGTVIMPSDPADPSTGSGMFLVY